MCGIVGRVNFLTHRPIDQELLRRMTNQIAHRGPDAEGFYLDGPVAFGNRRLAIVDLSEAGHQPMSTEDDQLHITYNGEVYNFPQLRSDLVNRGHSFRSNTDTEVILRGYREYGTAVLAKLRGMFAFAIWDRRNATLFIARDRFGKKPLYYYVDQDGIAFASEVKAFLQDPKFVAKPDPEAISHYLTLQYVPHPFSAFSGVRKLPPAHFLLLSGKDLSIQRYWKLSFVHKRKITEEEAAAETLQRLREAVQCRLISDVPLGAFLSGGIDSSTVVAIMAQASSASVKTFSIGFDEPDFDELGQARLVAARYGTDHHEFVVRPDALDVLPRLVWHYDEPFADSSALPTYYLSQLTRQHVTVALNGDGGDENFGGYYRYIANLRAERLPRAIRIGLRWAVRHAPQVGPLRRRRSFLDGIAEAAEYRYARLMSHFGSESKRELCTVEFLEMSGANRFDSLQLIADLARTSDATNLVDRMLDVDINSYLPGDLLAKVDVATMAHGLEARSPFLDHEFAEFCASLPSDLKIRGSVTKYILKRAVSDLLPAAIINRPKMGFGVPIERWLRADLGTFAEETLLSQRAIQRGYFRPEFIRRMLDEHSRGLRRWHPQLWNLLMLELWHQTFIDAPRRDS